MDSALDFHGLRALLQWQVELGVDEAIGDVPVNRYDLEEAAPKAPQARAAPAQPRAAQVAPPQAGASDAEAVEAARRAAGGAQDLDALRAALAAFEHCELKRGARNLVFSDGVRGARVMVIGEAPGRDEDREGRPFVGQAGRMLDRMLAAIGLSREENVYITNVVPWRPPQNADPKPAEIEMMRPFVERHVALAAPEIVIVMGNISSDCALQKRGITKLRGEWHEAWGRPVLPMTHPAYLLRTPSAKRAAWADLLAVQARLRGMQS
ncbi:uracil-DNA glycosylase [Roseovarius aquimarinus]|uniref:Type-4 uracil-DNA glycosylase n=1 Tax=Roseovarius aquimarinus TaxID=1229156 RepID=A0ABW7I9M5_9RHOB